ncbi:hypothetical protein [Iodobacter fluviatilis]|uniref:Uncharacterized protein n=1 Tax=Iodobacter fluviatilis TaxID=537 RepID=A0A7G3GF47_9NEIS|nr:hypothetical protein [Iodobacter fluviatilis]QBC45966.1 hypothetical protein C1H71_20740 [Iodobacter fluviatilis]
MAGIKRTHGSQARQQKEPLLDHQLLEMLAFTPNTLAGARDRAILALGFAGAFRAANWLRLSLLILNLIVWAILLQYSA